MKLPAKIAAAVLISILAVSLSACSEGIGNMAQQAENNGAQEKDNTNLQTDDNGDNDAQQTDSTNKQTESNNEQQTDGTNLQTENSGAQISHQTENNDAQQAGNTNLENNGTQETDNTNLQTENSDAQQTGGTSHQTENIDAQQTSNTSQQTENNNEEQTNNASHQTENNDAQQTDNASQQIENNNTQQTNSPDQQAGSITKDEGNLSKYELDLSDSEYSVVVDVEFKYFTDAKIIIDESLGNKAIIKTDDDIINSLNISIDGSAKEITIRGTTKYETSTFFEISIGVPVNKLRVSGAFYVSMDAPSVTSIAFFSNGALEADLKFDRLDSFALDVKGACSAAISGYADTSSILLDGAGAVNAFELITKSTTVEINGAGNCNVYASESLNASIAGIGSIIYDGNPSNINRSSGLTGIIKAR